MPLSRLGIGERGSCSMQRAIIALLVLSFALPSSRLLAQENQQLTVADWSFEVTGVVKAPTFSDVVHLGAQDDGRDWLVVTLQATNTSTDTQELHSDKIQLQIGSESVKQTGSESESVANELGSMTIGGSFPHDVDAGETVNIVQVYKVAPDAPDFTLVFDFSGKWEIPLDALVASSVGNPRVLLGEEFAETETAAPGAQADWSVATANFRLTLIGAVTAPMFSGPFHLGQLDDGRAWLVMTYRLENMTSREIEIASETISILSAGEDVRQAGDETRSVADELDLVAPSLKLGPDQEVVVVQVFKVGSGTVDNTLQVSSAGEWFLNLRPVIQAADGNPAAVVPGTALNIADVGGQADVAQAIPTAAPSPTPAPTAPPEPTALPRAGSGEAPGAVGETLELDGMAVTLLSGVYTYEHNFSTPKGGYVFLIVEVELRNTSDETLNYNTLSFAAKDLDTDADYDDAFALLDTPLGSGELSPGEYVYGQVALEIQETSTNVRVKYTVSPGLLGGGDAVYWLVPR